MTSGHQLLHEGEEDRDDDASFDRLACLLSLDVLSVALRKNETHER